MKKIQTQTIKKSGFLFSCIFILYLTGTNAQTLSDEYLKRAELMYSKVWNHNRVPAHPGLFTENFPSKGADTLTYMEGGGVKEKAVSFLWPFSGMFSATNVLLQIPSLKTKYLSYLDTCVLGMEKYR